MEADTGKQGAELAPASLSSLGLLGRSLGSKSSPTSSFPRLQQREGDLTTALALSLLGAQACVSSAHWCALLLRDPVTPALDCGST